MDCFTVSIVFGVLLRRYDWRTILTTAFLFGLFQALMPLVGWLCTAKLSTYIENVDHWVAFGLLSFLGGRMIVESFRDDDADHHFNPRNIKTQLTFAVATSIDALAVGISLACLGYTSMPTLVMPLAVIGFVSLAFSITGSILGIRFGNGVAKRMRPELIGGTVLIAIGLKVLFEHLFG